MIKRNTFQHAARLAGEFRPPLDESFDELEEKLGFAEPVRRSAPANELTPAVGSEVDVEPLRTPGRALAIVRERSGRKLRLELKETLTLRPGTEVLLFAPHPSALLEASGTVQAAKENTVSVRIDRPFQQSGQRKLGSNALKAFVRREGSPNETVPVELLSISSTGALLRCNAITLKKRDDIQLVFRRHHAQWTAINGEIFRVRRRGRKAWMRFSHLKQHARQTILK